jgi:hypothetical protein
MFGSLHFITNQLGDLIMQESEPQKTPSSDIDRILSTSAQDSTALSMQPEHETNLMRESESGSSGNNIDCFGLHSPRVVDPIYNYRLFSESDSNNSHEVFMVGQGDAPTDPTEEETIVATAVEIARSERLARAT